MAKNKLKKVECPVVLVGPYRADQMKKWILPKGYYNYPVGKEDDCTPEHCKRIRELWLYKGKSARKVFSAEFIGVKTRAELPDYPATKTKPHGEKYLLFKVTELYGPQLENATVHVRVSDFTKRTPKIAAAIKAFQEGSKAKPKSAKHLQALGAAGILAEVLPVEISQVPPERLCVREAAVQLDFIQIMYPERAFPSVGPLEYVAGAITRHPRHEIARPQTRNGAPFRLGEFFCGPGGLACGAMSATIENPLFKIEHAWSNDYDQQTCGNMKVAA